MGWTTTVTDSELVAIHAALAPTEPDGVIVYFGHRTGGEGDVGVQEATSATWLRCFSTNDPGRTNPPTQGRNGGSPPNRVDAAIRYTAAAIDTTLCEVRWTAGQCRRGRQRGHRAVGSRSALPSAWRLRPGLPRCPGGAGRRGARGGRGRRRRRDPRSGPHQRKRRRRHRSGEPVVQRVRREHRGPPTRRSLSPRRLDRPRRHDDRLPARRAPPGLGNDRRCAGLGAGRRP